MNKEEYPFFSIVREPPQSGFYGRYTIVEVGNCVDEEDYRQQYVLNPKGKPYRFAEKNIAIVHLNKIAREEQIDPEYNMPHMHTMRGS